MLATLMDAARTFMDIALVEASAAGERGEVPVGAVLVSEAREILSQAGNRSLELSDPTAHAEILAIREAARNIGKPRLPDCSLYVTLEPCAMCATAISFARLARLYYAVGDPKGGGVEHGPRIFSQATCHHAPELYPGIGDARASRLLRDFFQARR